MVVELRKRRLQILPFRVIFWSLVSAMLFAAIFQQNPMTIAADPDRSEGFEHVRNVAADTLVVLDYEAIRQSGSTFAERDFSAAWIDVLQQEIGPVTVATPETLTEEMIDESRLVIATHSVSRQMPPAVLERLRQHALDGHTVVVDRPTGEAREVFSADGQAGPRSGQAITHAEGMGAPFDEQLEQMPLFVDYIGSTAARRDAETLLSIDGAPVIYAVPFGRGTAITVDFDLVRQLVTLKQGRPADDFSLPRNPETASTTPRTSDLVADESLHGAGVPYAALLERFVVYGVFMRYASIPALWHYPDGAPGAVIFVHEDARLGDDGAWKLEYEAAYGGGSTLLTTFDSGLTAEGAERIRDRGGHIGLAWRPPHPSVTRYQRLGIGPFEPFRQPVDLPRQREQLGEVLTGSPVGTSRSLHGLWTDHWSAPLEALAEAGIRSDVSYESSTHRGFAFGTGLPFRALNDEGMPLQIRQYPVAVPPDADEGPPLQQLLASSAAGHHQLLTIATRPSSFADYPDMERFDQWLEFFDQIREQDHALLHVAAYARYQRNRRSAELRSRLDDDALLPESLQSEDTAPGHSAKLLRITAQTDRSGMELVIPANIGDSPLFDALEGTERVGTEIVTNRLDTEKTTIAGLPVHRVKLRAGFNNLEFYYR